MVAWGHYPITFSALQPLEKVKQMKTVAALLSATLFLTELSFGRAAMGGRFDAVLDPYTETSQSGEFTLHVTPSDYEGFGPGEYAFSQNGKPLWVQKFPFTFHEARVSGTGLIVGYAFARIERDEAARTIGNLVVALISPTGELRSTHVEPVEFSRFIDASPTPVVEGLMLIESEDRFILRVADPDLNRGIEQWWIFDLASGDRVDVVEPENLLPSTDASRWIVAAEPVAETPLMLCHWWVYEDDRPGGLFTLVDIDGKVLWSLPLPGDYEVAGGEDEEDRLRYEIEDNGAIASSGVPGVFGVRIVKTKERVSYTVKVDGRGKWTVAEASRRPYQKPVEEIRDPLAGLPEVSLIERGVVVLETGISDERSPIHDIQSFDFDADGNIAILKHPPQAAPSVVFATPDGQILEEMELPVEPLTGYRELSNIAHMTGKSFVIAVSVNEEGGMAACYRIDFDDDSFIKLNLTDVPPIMVLAAFEDGTIAALTERDMKYSSASGLYILDKAGRTLWNREDHGTDGSPDDLLSPEDMVVLAPDHVAILDNIKSTIQIFNRNGEFVRVVDFSETLNREHMYPTDLALDETGFIVYDFAGDESAVLMDGEGNPTATFTPRFADGRPFRVQDGVKRGPDGSLWTSDGMTVIRLDESGTVDRIIGNAPQTRVLNEPCVRSTAVSQSGQVYIGDEQTMTVHVFDEDGKWQTVCVPDPGDLTDSSWFSPVTASNSGDIFASFTMDENYVQFASAGERMGTVTLDREDISTELYCHPDGNRLWALGYRDVYLAERSGMVLKKISRRIDGYWLDFFGDAAVAPDGSIALIAGSRERSLNTFTSTGEPIGLLVLNSDTGFVRDIAFDGSRAYVQVERQLFVVKANGIPIATANLDFIDDLESWRGPFLYPADEELWFVNAKDLRVHRYALSTYAAP
jgi:hypothetical protein